MSLLINLINNKNTDKDTVHSYLPLYEILLRSKKYTAKNILEVGIGNFKEKNGGSIKMWYDYFVNANIYSIDILSIDRVLNELKNKPRIKLYTSVDAYDETFFNNNILNKNIKFDMLLDDGPHTLESMKQFIRLYSQVINDDGILMIEDVQSISWIEVLKSTVPDYLKKYIDFYDLRKNKDRYDDIVFVINTSNKSNKYFNFDEDVKTYKMPEDFNFDVYRSNYDDIKYFTNKQISLHWHSWGKNESRVYKNDYSDVQFYKMPEDFNFNVYRTNYNDMKDFTNEQIVTHWNNFGKNEGRVYKNNNSDIKLYKMPEDFNFDFYRNNYDDLKDFTNGQIAIHWNNFGKNEDRKYN